MQQNYTFNKKREIILNFVRKWLNVHKTKHCQNNKNKPHFRRNEHRNKNDVISIKYNVIFACSSN